MAGDEATSTLAPRYLGPGLIRFVAVLVTSCTPSSARSSTCSRLSLRRDMAFVTSAVGIAGHREARAEGPSARSSRVAVCVRPPLPHHRRRCSFCPRLRRGATVASGGGFTVTLARASGDVPPAAPPPSAASSPLGRRAFLTRMATAASGVVAAAALASGAAPPGAHPPSAMAASPTSPAVGPTTTNGRREGDTPPETGFVTKSGLRFFDFKVGSGDRPPAWGDLLTVSYVLYTVSPSGDRLDVADSTYARNKHMLIHHGNGQTILGVEEALHGMRVGGRRRVVIPPALGYTSSGLGPVPPRTTKRRALNKTLNEGTAGGTGGRVRLERGSGRQLVVLSCVDLLTVHVLTPSLCAACTCLLSSAPCTFCGRGDALCVSFVADATVRQRARRN